MTPAERGVARTPSSPRAADDPIAQLLAGTWPDPDAGRPARIDIARVAIEPSLAGREAELVESLHLGRRLAVVSDANTHEVLGARVARALAPLAAIDVIELPRGVHADADTAARVRAASRGADALVAVGSGTINDLAKYAAAQERKPYAVFATAPSMNGYTSANAAITVDGHKRTLPAALPRGVFIDLAVLAAAPVRMIRAGLGDSLCRPTAQLDWLLSHLLLGTPYREGPFALLARDEAALFDAPEALVAGDAHALRALARTLVLSGMGMTLSGGSYPASQGEHLISHYLDMRAVRADGALHGEQVGVATLAMARLQEALLDAPAPPVVRATRMNASALGRHLGAEVGAACWQAFAPKRLDDTLARTLNERIRACWDELRRRAAPVRVPAARLASILERARAPTRPGDLGIGAPAWRDAVRHARFLRDRFTFLDLADDSGALASDRPG